MFPSVRSHLGNSMTDETTSNDCLYTHDFVAVKRCRHGMFMYNRNDTFVGKSLDLYGEWGEAELHILRPTIQPRSIVLDIGANIGSHTIPFARWVGPSGRVYAYEPQRLAFQMLCANAAMNALTNVFPLHAGAGKARSVCHLPEADPRRPDNIGARPMVERRDGVPVDVIPVDDLALPACHLIKIDVEGMEVAVLEGSRATICRCLPVLFVENNTLERSADIIETVNSLDYEGYWHLATYYNHRNFRQNPSNVFQRFHPEANMLCVHRSQSEQISGLEKVAGPNDNWRMAAERLQHRR